MHWQGLWIIGATLLLTACGGGGGGDDEQNEQTYSLQGTITAAENIDSDSDVNDPFAPYASNDTPAQAQSLRNPVMLSGFVSFTASGQAGDRFARSPDPLDLFRTQLTAGQFVSLQVADYLPGLPAAVDIDLYLYDINDQINPVAYSTSINEFESVQAPTDGEYLIHVEAARGISKYVLNIGSVSLAGTPLRFGWTTDFVPGQAIVKQRSESSGTLSIAPLSQISAVRLSHSEQGRPALLSLSADGELASVTRSVSAAAEASSLTSDELYDWQQNLSAVAQEKLRTLKLIKQLRGRADVEYAEPNFLVYPQRTPNDPRYNLQEHYPQIRLPQAWDVTVGTPSSGQVIVAVADTGVFLGHNDLSGQLVAGYDFISDSRISNDGDGVDSNPDDPGDNLQLGQSSWHGTHVAGTVAATTDNNLGVAGVSWGAKVMPIRVLGVGGGSLYDVSQGVRYAAGLSNDSGTVPNQRADIINMSLGGSSFSQSAQDDFNQIANAGVLVVAAAGNDNSSAPNYPAAYDNVISVSAVDWQNTRAPYSNFGSSVDVAGPGGNLSEDSDGDGYGDGVLSTIADDSSGTRASTYAFYQGTSMAAPHVAGVAALMKAIYPALTPDDFSALLLTGQLTQDLGTSGRDDIYGYGVIDAFKAVQAAANLAGGGALPGTLVATPTRLDFSFDSNSQSLTLEAVGTAPPGVVSFDDDADWLSVSPNVVDGNGIGSYNLSVNRSGLIEATYSATLNFNLSDSSVLSVGISMRVGAPATGNAGLVYLLLIDEFGLGTNLLELPSNNGSYAYNFQDIPAGNYLLIGGSDIDNDFLLCSIGESCAAFPVASQPQLITLNRNLSGVDFVASVINGLGLTQSDETENQTAPQPMSRQPTSKQTEAP